MQGLCTPAEAGQELVAPPSHAKEIARESFVSVLADALNPMASQSYQLSPAEPQRAIADSKPRRKYRATPTARRYQLNVRVSAAHRTAIKCYAKQRRIKVWEAVELAIAMLTREQ